MLFRSAVFAGTGRSQRHLRPIACGRRLFTGAAGAGLIALHPQANRRVAHLRPTPFRDLDDWLTRYRPLWEERLDRLDDYLRTLPPEEPTPDPTEPGGSP